MKKFFSIIISFLSFFFVALPSFADSNLYYVKNVQKSNMDKQLEQIFKDYNYTLLKKSPFHAVVQDNSAKYIVAVLQQSGTNLFYYYKTNTSNKVNKTFLKTLNKNGITFLQSSNQTLINNFENIAQKTLTGTTTTYSFEDSRYANSSANSVINKVQTNPNTLSGYVTNAGKGSKLEAYLQNPINTATANKGDVVEAILKTDWVINGKVIAPQGSIVYGSLTEAHSASIGMRNGGVEINFYKITTPENKSYDISTQKIDFDVSNDGAVKKTVTKALAMTAVGALLGLAVAACSSDHNIGTGAVIGAGIGAGGAVLASGLQSGIDAEIPSYTELEIIIEKDIRVVFND